MLRSLLLIGSGKAGTALTALASDAGVNVVGIAGSAAHPERARESATALDLDAAVWTGTIDTLPPDLVASAELVLIATPDDRIAAAAVALAARAESAPAGTRIALHCSGSQPSTILAPLRTAGFALGSLHPLKAMPDWRAARDTFAGTPCCIEGDEDAVPALADLATAIGGEPFTIPTAAKLHYHAGAVLASNHLVGLIAATAQLYTRQLGVTPQRALDLLLRLSRGTIDNLAHTGLPDALTGPIERGDVATVTAHMHALDHAAPDLAAAYRALSRLTLDVARDKAAAGSSTQTPEATAQLAALIEGQAARPVAHDGVD